jgi:hypothetical protein
MAFTMRQPLRLGSTIAVASKGAFKSAPIRSFHSSKPATNFFSSQTLKSASALTKARNAFKESRRTYMQQPTVPAANATLIQKLALGGAMIVGGVIATNLVFNRETREDGGMPTYEREYLNETFMHTGLGIGIIGLSARAMFQSGIMYRMMATNPWVVMIGGLGLSIGTMMGTRATSPDKYVENQSISLS